MRGIPRVVLASCLCSFAIMAQDTTELLNRMKAMEEKIKGLESEVQELKGQQSMLTAAVTAAAPVSPQPAAPVAPEQQAAAQAAPVLGGAGPAAAKVLNPDIAVIGDFLGGAGYGGSRSTPALQQHESEVAFQAILDPYARADFFFSFGEHGVDLEEGYLTFPALPGGVQLRVGKMRAAFGKVNTLHNHVLPWTDRPLVTQNLVGGEDGINDAGLSLSRIFAGPGQIFFEGTAQLFRGDSANLYQTMGKRSDVSTVGHVRAYRDITESTNLDLGVSYSRGHSVWGPNVIDQIYGMDATLRWKPLRRAIYHSVVGRSEVIWSRLRFPAQTFTPFGFYVSTDYQLGRRWFLGGRFDRSQRLGDWFTVDGAVFGIPSLNNLALYQDTGGSIVLTYWPSEFSQVRGQLRHTQYGANQTANELLFQFQFSIGAHGAHPF